MRFTWFEFISVLFHPKYTTFIKHKFIELVKRKFSCLKNQLFKTHTSKNILSFVKIKVGSKKLAYGRYSEI